MLEKGCRTRSREAVALRQILSVLAAGRIDARSRRKLERAGRQLIDTLDFPPPLQRPPRWRQAWAVFLGIGKFFGALVSLKTLLGPTPL